MPVDFLTEEQKATYGKFASQPNDMQLARYFHLDQTDLAFIANRRGDQNRLGFALQLTSLRFLGTFVSDLSLIPTSVKSFIAAQLSLHDLSILAKYAQRKTTKRDHAILIRKHYGYNEFGNFPWFFRLSRLLYTRAWLANERPSLLFDCATSWLIKNKVLLPGVTRLIRLISEIRERADNRLWQALSALPSDEQRTKLETLLQVAEGQRSSQLDNYRQSPVNISGPSFNQAIDRYKELKEFGIQELNFSQIPPCRLKNLARHAGVISMHKIARMPDSKRIAILVAFVKDFGTIALDDALDVLDLLITDIAGAAKKMGQKKRLRTLKDLDKAALILADMGSLILKTDGNQLRKNIFLRVSRDKLIESIAVIHDLARPADEHFHDEMVQQYGRVRKFLPSLLQDIELQAAPAGKSVLEAFHYLRSLGLSRQKFLDDAPLDIVAQPWKRLVFDKDKRITRRGYTLCFIVKLQDALRRRDVYVEKSERWGDPRIKLLQGGDWQSKRIQLCQALGHPINPQEAISALASQLDTTYKQVASNFKHNDTVKIDLSGKTPCLTIANLDKLETPESLVELNKQVNGLLPEVDLTELLLEVHAHTGFIDEFTHVSESNARADDLTISVCAVLMSEACNIGLEPLIKRPVSALTRHRLNWVKQNYLRAETLIRANARLVDYQSSLLLAKKWGGGEVASADGMRFVTPIRTINSGPNRKYFGSNRGITWYNFVSDYYTGFHGIVIPGTLRDSIFVLEGLPEQQTSLTPTEIMTDTAGASDMVFGLFWLLGYQFSPRLADAGQSLFWRVDKNADYGALNELARATANIHRIEQHWDDMLRIAGSLKLGTIQASELIRSLLKSEKPSSLAQAIIETGRINKTLYLLDYINDPDYRRRILTQLNRGEGRHAVARAICYGQRGEIRKRYREGQEDQLSALGLVSNCLILWNTIYMQASLDHLHQQSLLIREEDVARLSPLVTEHINMLGHYTFRLLENVLHGRLRPLNLPSDQTFIP